MIKNNQNYLNNPNLPAEGAVHEYDAEKVKELKKCQQNILHFAENYFFIRNVDEGKIKINLHKYQKRILRKLRDSRFFVLLSGRQAGKSTIMTIYALWIACFQEWQNVLIVANKESTAIEILKRIKLAYEELPNWLKPGVKKWAETSVVFENGSEILISTTTSSAARGMSINVLIIDEAAHIEPASMLEAFWRSVFPVVSSSKKAKIFMVSTPNGTGNLFHKTFTEAEASINGWGFDRVDWKEVPGRDERWKRDQILAMGDYNSYLQEFEAVFLDSGESSINEELQDRLKSFVKDPLYIMDEGCYKIYDEPKDNRIYVAGVDVSEGVGGDYSVINIFDITNLLEIKQVACYANNTITPHIFTKKLDEILTQWGKPLVCIERNNQGAQVVDNLRNIYMYENIVSWGASEAGRSKSQLGIISHTNTKQKGVGNMRYWVNTLRCVEFRDINLVKQLKDFVRYPNGTWAAKKGANSHDDLVMSMIWSLIVLEDSLVQKHFEVIRVDDNRRPLEIKALDYGIKYNVISNGMYNETDDINSGMPTIMGGLVNDTSDDVKWLQSQGWKTL
jgi:hypothetical protein